MQQYLEANCRKHGQHDHRRDGVSLNAAVPMRSSKEPNDYSNAQSLAMWAVLLQEESPPWPASKKSRIDVPFVKEEQVYGIPAYHPIETQSQHGGDYPHKKGAVALLALLKVS
jgi:hypothetical protein